MIVIIAVAAATPFAPNLAVNNAVDIDVAAILTTLFPTNIEFNNLLGLSIKDATKSAFFTPSSCIYLILILLNDIRDVSDAEKNADPIIRMTNPII